jgi:hypothetical protein
MPRLIPRLVTAVLSSFLALVGPAEASSFTDDFESYAVGSFPSAGWGDVRSVALPHAPLPSATVVDTTDAFGASTQALQTVDAAAASRGAFRPIAPAANHQLSADVRVDRFGPSSAGATPITSWPLLLGVAEVLPGSDLCCFPTAQVGLYVSTLTHGFRLFSTDGAGQSSDIELGASAALDTWYHVELELEVATGTVHSRVSDVLGGTTLVDQSNLIPGWTPAQFDVVTFFGGELAAADVTGIGTLDRIAYAPVPEPGTLALLSLGLAGGEALRRGARRS